MTELECQMTVSEDWLSPPAGAPTRRLTAVEQYVVSKGDFCLAAGVADVLGISPTTLRRWGTVDPEQLGPCYAVWFRGIELYLYDRDAIVRIERHLEQDRAQRSRAGRRRSWDPDERQDRRVRHSSASYHRRRSRELATAGDESAAKEHAERATAITTQLREEEARRHGSSLRPGDRGDVRPRTGL